MSEELAIFCVTEGHCEELAIFYATEGHCEELAIFYATDRCEDYLVDVANESIKRVRCIAVETPCRPAARGYFLLENDIQSQMKTIILFLICICTVGCSRYEKFIENGVKCKYEDGKYWVWTPDSPRWLVIMLPGGQLASVTHKWDKEKEKWVHLGESKQKAGHPTRLDEASEEYIVETEVVMWHQVSNGNYCVFRIVPEWNEPMWTVWTKELFEAVKAKSTKKPLAAAGGKGLVFVEQKLLVLGVDFSSLLWRTTLFFSDLSDFLPIAFCSLGLIGMASSLSTSRFFLATGRGRGRGRASCSPDLFLGCSPSCRRSSTLWSDRNLKPCGIEFAIEIDSFL